MPRFEPIDDPGDPRIEAYRDVRERDLVGRQGLFVAEGEVVLGRLIGSERFRTVSALVDRRRLDKLAPMLARLGDEVPVFCADRGVFDEIAGFPMHRGILGLGALEPAVAATDLLAGLGPDALVLALFAIANHDNLGGIFRNAAAFGVDAVILDGQCCDPLYRKALRVSVGGALQVPYARTAPGEDLPALLASQGFEPLALTPAGDTPLAQVRPAGRTAVLLGAEGPGLPPEVIAAAKAVSIPMAAGFDSLNVATTSGIVLHHLTRGR
ncbi:MAG TPA: RNA methyltransferase, partial [Caulobacteraceae bacterium]|nr:RNA methyltransferase [Caulobacteraceae bacterium]